ncbi:MAG: FUSC family protein [Methylococcus sp.]|nr:FUSC family protein [Methylococcus sp.]
MSAEAPRTLPGSDGNSRQWFGTTLLRFLRDEFKDSPGRKLGALRLFIGTMAIALVSETLLRPPHVAAVAITISLGLNPRANAGQSLELGLRMFGYLVVMAGLCIFSLALAGNEPWLLMPWSFAVMALALFHSRYIGQPTAIATWYSLVVLYSAATPQQNIYTALWVIPIMGGLGVGIWTLVQLAVKPQDPQRLLDTAIVGHLATVETVIAARLADHAGGAGRTERTRLSAPGNFAATLELLRHTQIVHPALRRKHNAYVRLLVEIDGLRRIAVWLDQSLPGEHRAQPMSPRKLDAYRRLRTACEALRLCVEESRDVSAQTLALLPDPAADFATGQPIPSLPTAMAASFRRIAEAIAAIHAQTPTRALVEPDTGAGEEKPALPAWLGYEFWAANIDTVQYGIKFSLGAILCALIVQALAWPGIETAILTCLVVAQTSLGADYRQSLLRFSGAALGGLCAYAYALAAQPAIDTIVGFAFATAPVFALAAWIAAGSPRIAYMGKQIGYSFAIFVLHDLGPVTDLYLLRDRVLGIFLGIAVMGVLDYALWPRRSISLARNRTASALQALAAFTARPADAYPLREKMLALRITADKNLASAQDFVGHAALEPDATIASTSREREALSELIRDASDLSGLLLIRRRYRALGGVAFGDYPNTLRGHALAFDSGLAGALNRAAMVLQGREPGLGSEAIAELHRRLERGSAEHHAVDRLSAEPAMAWELRRMLDRQIVAIVERIERRATYLSPHS